MRLGGGEQAVRIDARARAARVERVRHREHAGEGHPRGGPEREQRGGLHLDRERVAGVGAAPGVIEEIDARDRARMRARSMSKQSLREP